jgi:serine/threonine-protein kinase
MIGDVISNRYELLEKISSSPIFDSYLARDKFRTAEVCIRFVNEPFSSQTGFIQALAAVTERAALLDHPNIARVYGMGDYQGRPYLICEALKGSSLVERIRRIAPFSPPVACEIGIGICDALDYAASRGMPHGDLCADHVLTNLEGHVAVIDFGLWESYGKSSSAGAMVLPRMAPYLAPEVIQGQNPDPCSDVYALGVILFELLTGSLPFSGPSPGAILEKHATLPPPSTRTLNPAVPSFLDHVASKAMAKNPDERYQSAKELKTDLESLKDALRFGKQLQWQGGAAETATTPAAAAEQSQPRRARRPRVEDDVPAWLRNTVYVLGGMALALVLGWIALNLTKKKEIELPNLVGLTVAEARQKAKAVGVNLVVDSEQYNEKFPQPDTIVSTDPGPRTHVRAGTEVRATRSLGSVYLNVPDLRGVPLDEAKRRLQAAGFRLSDKIKEEPSSTIQPGMVIETSPGRGQRVSRNAAISIVVSQTSGKEGAANSQDPDEMPNTWTLRFRVKDSADFVSVRVEMTDEADDDRVIFEEPRAGGDYVELPDIEGTGRRATFRIYFDDRLAQTRRLEGNRRDENQ